jgi:hypothetical protein
MNSIPSILEPLGGIPGIRGEQQEEEINPDLSIPPVAEDDADEDSSAVTAIIHDGAAGVAEDVARTEATAPPIFTTSPSNSGGSRKLGVATTARATLSSKKKKVATQCRKGAHVKVTRSNLFHVLEHDEQRDTERLYK